MVDEDARELVADRLVDEQGGNGAVDAAREAAEDTLGADARADPADLLLDHRHGRPRRRGAGDTVEEVLQHLLAVRGVDDLEVELDPVEPARRILERTDTGRARAGDDAGARRRGDDAVSVAHPDGLPGREIAEEGALAGGELGPPELADACLLDAAAELQRQELHAVADPERRDPEREDRGVERGAPSAYTEAGPPERISAAGLRRAISSALAR